MTGWVSNCKFSLCNQICCALVLLMALTRLRFAAAGTTTRKMQAVWHRKRTGCSLVRQTASPPSIPPPFFFFLRPRPPTY